MNHFPPDNRMAKHNGQQMLEKNIARILGAPDYKTAQGPIEDQFWIQEQLNLPNSPLNQALGMFVAVLAAEQAQAKMAAKYVEQTKIFKDALRKLVAKELKLEHKEKHKQQQERRKEERTDKESELQQRLNELTRNEHPDLYKDLISPEQQRYEGVIAVLESPLGQQVAKLDVQDLTAEGVKSIQEMVDTMIEKAGGAKEAIADLDTQIADLKSREGFARHHAEAYRERAKTCTDKDAASIMNKEADRLETSADECEAKRETTEINRTHIVMKQAKSSLISLLKSKNDEPDEDISNGPCMSS